MGRIWITLTVGVDVKLVDAGNADVYLGGWIPLIHLPRWRGGLVDFSQFQVARCGFLLRGAPTPQCKSASARCSFHQQPSGLSSEGERHRKRNTSSTRDHHVRRNGENPLVTLKDPQNAREMRGETPLVSSLFPKRTPKPAAWNLRCRAP